MTSLHSRNNANIVKWFMKIYLPLRTKLKFWFLSSGEMFSNAHDFVVNGGNYYSGRIFIQQPLDHGK